MRERKSIAILGSTGSIGVNALKVIHTNQDKYRAVALAAGRNLPLLLEQVKDFQPAVVAILEEPLARKLKAHLCGQKRPEILYGNEGFIKVATLDEADTVISALSGAVGLLPTYAAIKAGKRVALANKETMVMAGNLVMAEAKKRDVSVLPIDSEHSAICQSLQGHPRQDVRRVVLTASGGPFRDWSLADMGKVTPAQALKHPNWEMGPKISVDSATMMNKGLEAIEAKWLFGLSMDQISILIHPQSIIHSMVEYKDGSLIAQMGVPHMMIPISYALSFPRHLSNSLDPLDLERVGRLTFQKPDLKRFKCLELALVAAKTGGSMPAVLNGANEIAVDAFLNGKAGFLDIPKLIMRTMERHEPHPIGDIETVMEADRWARGITRGMLAKAPFA